jgi:hypothetical protein
VHRLLWDRFPHYRFCSMRCLDAGAASARENNGMIDKTARELQALKDARKPFAEALTNLGLMDAFFNRTAAEIDVLLEAAVTGFIESMQHQVAANKVSGQLLDDQIPF